MEAAQTVATSKAIHTTSTASSNDRTTTAFVTTAPITTATTVTTAEPEKKTTVLGVEVAVLTEEEKEEARKDVAVGASVGVPAGAALLAWWKIVVEVLEALCETLADFLAGVRKKRKSKPADDGNVAKQGSLVSSAGGRLVNYQELHELVNRSFFSRNKDLFRYFALLVVFIIVVFIWFVLYPNALQILVAVYLTNIVVSFIVFVICFILVQLFSKRCLRHEKSRFQPIIEAIIKFFTIRHPRILPAFVVFCILALTVFLGVAWAQDKAEDKWFSVGAVVGLVFGIFAVVIFKYGHSFYVMEFVTEVAHRKDIEQFVYWTDRRQKRHDAKLKGKMTKSKNADDPLSKIAKSLHSIDGRNPSNKQSNINKSTSIRRSSVVNAVESDSGGGIFSSSDEDGSEENTSEEDVEAGGNNHGIIITSSIEKFIACKNLTTWFY